MPRLDTIFPPEHVRCLDGAAVLPPAVVAGLLDGHGSAGIEQRGTSGGVRRTRPYIALTMPDDDPTPFAVFAAADAHIGRSVGSAWWAPARRQNAWRVTRLRDVVEVAAWLRSSPPLTPRLEMGLAVARSVALARLTGAEDPTRSGPTHPLDYRSVATDHLAGVAVGLVASDGYFTLRSPRSRFAPLFLLIQRLEVEPLLEEFERRLGIGAVEPHGGTRADPRAVALAVRRRADARRLEDLLEAEPLPVGSKAAAEYRLWRQAWRISSDRSLPLPVRRERMAATRDALASARRHGARRFLCSCTGATESGTSRR